MPAADGSQAEHLLGRESSRALWEMTWTPLAAQGRATGIPMLAVHGEQDLMIPGSALDEIAARWGAEARTVAGVGHVPMIERRWRTVAGVIDRWLQKID
jgi:pimeloyl-ACP methyl ester carboxylesterase